MATWEDGPEYAPLERPTGFSLPEAPPLRDVPPAEQLAARAPIDRPVFDRPEAPVAPLEQLIPVVADERDPGTPFAVVSSTVTSMDSAWGAAHWSHTTAGPEVAPPPAPAPYPVIPYPASTAQPGLAQYPAAAPAQVARPAENHWPAPTAPVPPVTGPAQLPGGYPPPGTPQWFGPGPYAPPPPAPTVVNARAVATAATPGLLICLAIGCVFFPFAPIMLGVAFFLSQRVKVAYEAVRRAFGVALGFLGLFAVVGFLRGELWFYEWWSYLGGWALFISWVLLITVVVLVYRGLKKAAVEPPRYQPPNYPPPGDWGQR